MNLQISGKNIDLTPANHQYAEDKLGTLDKIADDIIEVRVTIEQKHEHHDAAYETTVHVHASHDDLHCTETHSDMYASIDLAKDEMQRLLRDRKLKYHADNRKAATTQREMKSIFKAEELDKE